MSGRIVHEIVDGECIRCHDTEEWLLSRGELVEYTIEGEQP